MKRNLPGLLTTAFLTLALINPALAQNQGGQGTNQPQVQSQCGQSMNQQDMGQQGPQTMKQRFMKKFGVTDEQATKIEALKEAKEKAQRETSARQKIIRAEAEYLWMADKVDKKAIMAKYTEIEQLKRKSFTADVDFKYALTEVLTPQQRSELMNMMQQRRGKMGQRDMDSHQRGDRNQQNWQGQRGQGGFNQQNWQGQRGQGGFNQQIWQGQRGQGGFNQQNWQGQRGQGGYKQQGGQGYDDGGYDFDNVTDGDSL